VYRGSKQNKAVAYSEEWSRLTLPCLPGPHLTSFAHVNRSTILIHSVMLTFASRGAGPGPSTLAFRLSLARKTLTLTPIQAWPAQTRPHTVYKFKPKPVIPNIKKPPPAPFVTTLTDPREVIDATLKSFRKRDTRGIVDSWKRLCQLDAIGHIKPKEFVELSEHIWKIFITQGAEILSHREQYTVLEDIAIQEVSTPFSSRHYETDIQHMSPKLSKSTRPPFTKYKARHGVDI